MNVIIIAVITIGAMVAITAGTVSYQQNYDKKCIESGNIVTGFLQCTGKNCDFGLPKNTTGISIPKKIFVSNEEKIHPEEAIAVLGTNSTVIWANHALDNFVLEFNDGSQSVLIPSCSSARISFDEPGIYEYHEKNNPKLKGKVIVLEKDSPSAEKKIKYSNNSLLQNWTHSTTGEISSIDISEDNSVIAVGTKIEETQSGTLYLFDSDGTLLWGKEFDSMISNVDISNNTILVKRFHICGGGGA